MEEKEELQRTLRTASECSHHVHRVLAQPELAENEFGVTLTMHMGLGCGDLGCMHVGGAMGRWEYVLCGEAMHQIAVAEPLAQSGQTVLSPYCAQLLQGTWECLDIAEAPKEHEKFKILGRPLDHKGFPRSSSSHELVPLKSAGLSEQQVSLISKHIKYCMRYIPGAIHRNLRNGATEFAEVREMSMVFVLVTNVDLYMDGDLERGSLVAQQLLDRMQSCIYEYEGSVNKYLVDDKGLLLLAAFGMPPLTHSDDPSRAVAAALDIVRSCGEIGYQCQVGVTTGRVFCGICGSLRNGRCEYTLLGDSVNIAARLMQKAGTGGVLVDEVTKNESETQFLYTAQTPVELKGKANLTPVFRPLCPTELSRCASNNASVAAASQVVGNWATLGELREKLSDMVVHRGGILVIDGQQGSGKSDVISQVGAYSQGLDLVQHEGGNQPTSRKSDSFPASEPMLPFVPLLISMICGYYHTDLAIEEGVDQCCMMLLELVERMLPERNRSNMKLLVPIFRTWMEKYDQRFTSANGDSAVEVDPTHPTQYSAQKDVCFSIISFYASKTPTLILFHMLTGNDHKAKQLSDLGLELLHQIGALTQSRRASMQSATESNKVPPALVLCIAGRVTPSEHPGPLEALFNEYKVTLRVKPLSPERAESVLCKLSNVQSVSPQVATFLYQTAGGNFKQIRDVAKALHKNRSTVERANILVFTDDAKEGLQWTANSRPKTVPKSTERFWMSMFDQLEPFEQWVMKLSAVIISHSLSHFVSAEALESVMNENDIQRLTVVILIPTITTW